MKAATILSAVALFSLIGAAHALDIKPYSAVTLKTLQQSGQGRGPALSCALVPDLPCPGARFSGLEG
jgi:hypothetical protein